MDNTNEPGRVWRERDYPVLKACAELLEDESVIQERDIMRVTGFQLDEVLKAVIHLRERYVHGKTVDSMGGPVGALVTGLTAQGLEAAGIWPTPEDVTARLIAALEQEYEQTPEGSPKSNKIQALLSAARDMGTGAGTAVLGQLVLRAVGM